MHAKNEAKPPKTHSGEAGADSYLHFNFATQFQFE